MPKSISSITLSLLLLISSVTGISATTNDAEKAFEERFKAQFQQMVEKSGKIATRDQLGRVTKTTLSFSGKDYTFDFKYDKQNRLSSIVSQSGDITEYKYDQTGKLERVVLPDGDSVKYEYNGNGNVIRVKHERGFVGKNSTGFVHGAHRVNTAMVDDCSDAMIRASIAVAAMGVTCAAGGILNPMCVVAMASAAFLTAKMVEACNGGGSVAPVENAV